ncbi:coiled-coil domain-containing protein 74A-like [Syngnathus typhle]|uniref:coiled-coil domain-containing protein 74A-like n=1 Tax=Syngnathus typhle TaxID=161592 RepID=UPI002A6ADF9A|nr:coiled-coil domain-containing protein 74A-like [Syngnathus typhle]
MNCIDEIEGLKMIMDGTIHMAPKQSQVGVGPVVRGREPGQNQMRRNMGDYAEVHGPYRANRGYSASLQPLQVHNGLSNPPRASTLRECELIIRQLYNTNRSQSQQIVRYKELLEDIVLNKRKRITPENYNLTKAFLADDIWTGIALPALTQGLNSSVAERQRRNRAVHRSHVKGTVR